MTQRTAYAPTCGEPDSIESVHHVLLHCPAYEHHRAALRTKVAGLPAAQASPPVLSDEEGVIAFLRDDFMGCAEEATSAAHAFLQAVITLQLHYNKHKAYSSLDLPVSPH